MSTNRTFASRSHVSRRRVATLTAAALSSTAVVVGVAAPNVAAEVTDPCLMPKVADIMITQGLPTYKRLSPGKLSLVKYFLSVPSCAPSGTKIEITGGSLVVTSSPVPIELQAALPLPPLGPASTAPVPAAQSDPLFMVPGTALMVPGEVRFTATLTFRTTTSNGSSDTGKLEVTTRPSGEPVTAVVERPLKPLRVLAVAMGDPGTAADPKSYDSQFPQVARDALSAGMTSLNRVLPVASGVNNLLTPGTAGLRYSLAAGLVNLGLHDHDQKPSTGEVNYMMTGKYCGSSGHQTDIEFQLGAARNNWNSFNPAAPVDRAYGVVWQDKSRGITTGTVEDETCIEGFGRTAGWGRVIDAVKDADGAVTRPPLTGTIATMELLHTTGAVASKDTRSNGGAHSTHTEADGTAPERAWNTGSAQWISDDRSAMRFSHPGWHDASALLEKADYDNLQCQLLPALIVAQECPEWSPVGQGAAAGGDPTVEYKNAFFISGYTNPERTVVHSYIDDDVNYDRPEPASQYRFVQRNTLETDPAKQITSDLGLPVSFEYSSHDGTASGGNGHTTSDDGTFAAEFRAEPTTNRIEIWKGTPGAGALLYARDKDAAPQFVGVSAEGRSLTVTASDNKPDDLRLDLFLDCPSGVSPVVSALLPTAVVGTTATFVTHYDTSLACPGAKIIYRVTDGYQVAIQDEDEVVNGGLAGTASITTPAPDEIALPGAGLVLTGAGWDAFGMAAEKLVWTISGPTYSATPGSGVGAMEVGSGEHLVVTPPGTGFSPGEHTLTLRAKNGDTVVATATRKFSFCKDTDGDGICDTAELQPCYAADAATDPTNAAQDADVDGTPNINDPEPCTSTTTASAKFSPTSLQHTSSGNAVTINVSAAEVDLTKVPLTAISLVQIAGHSASIPAYAWEVTDAQTATAKFDRAVISKFLHDNQLLGYVPMFLAAPEFGLRAVDRTSPTVFP